MRLKIREIPYAYVGAHCEVVGPLGVRVYPLTSERTMKHPGLGGTAKVVLGTNRDACKGFLAGYEFARKEVA